MKSYLSLAFKELKAQKITAALILAAVILSSLMTTAISTSLGILQEMRIEQAASLNGNRYGTFHQLTGEQAEKIVNDPRLYDVGVILTAGSVALADGSLSLFAREYAADALEAYPFINRLKEGRLPEAPMEIALPENSLPYFGREIHVGDTVTLSAGISLMDGSLPSYGYSADFKVCGILEANYVGYATGTLEAVLGLGSASALLPESYLLYSADFKVRDEGHFQALVDELAQSLGIPEAHIQYNWVLLDALGISYDKAGSSDTDTGFSFMTLAAVLIGLLVLLAAGLVIYNILKIAVTKRIREFGALRAIGSERGQIYRLVSLELLTLCGIGIPIGLCFGALSAKGILIAATGIFNPDLFLAESTAQLNDSIRQTTPGNVLPYFAGATITLLFAMLAAFPAAHYASHVSPTLAMSGQKVTLKRRNRKVKPIRNFEAYYARLNLKRGRGRTLITILSLVMSITVFVALQSFSSLLDTSRDVQELNPGDYSVTNETTGMEPQSVEELQENEWVERLSTTKLSIYPPDEHGRLPLTLDFSLEPWEAFHIAGIDEDSFTSFAPDLSEQDKSDLRSGSACIVKNPIPFTYEGETVAATTFQAGDTLSVNGHPLRVAAITQGAVSINNQGYLNGVQIIVNEETYDLLTGTDHYSEIYPILRQDADSDLFEDWLGEWCDQNPGSHWLSYRQTDAQLVESFRQIRMLCWGLILLIGLIGILNIINTVYSNIHTRISEIGIQRAIGMDTKSLYKTFLWEGAYYGLIASAAGGLLGYVCTVFINAATTDALTLVAPPVLSLAQAALVSVAACLLATVVPLRAIARLNIVRSIDAVE